jgi:hypothetical protein
MSRLSHGAAVAALMVLVAPSVSFARTHHASAGVTAGAHNSASDMDVRKQCYAEARQRYPSTNQDMQTNRDFAYRTCAVDHGVQNP